VTFEAHDVEQHIARLRGPASDGESADPGDLDWVLFRSFPGCEIGPETLAECAPAYVAAVRNHVVFDRELLFVRLLEAGDALPPAFRREVADAAAHRLLAGDYDPDDAIPVFRYVIRAAPDPDAVVVSVVTDPDLDALRFALTVDFALDERDLDDYFAVSYLRDGDPDSGPRLRAFPVPPGVRRELSLWLSEPAVRARLETGWTRHPDDAERERLRRGLEQKLPGLELDAVRPTRSTP
jgi:hypothetical protein